MSRLTAGDVRGIDRRSLAHADRALLESTGLTLFGLACRAAGLEEAAGRELAARVTAAVVPMNCGEGLIPGFAAAARSRPIPDTSAQHARGFCGHGPTL